MDPLIVLDLDGTLSQDSELPYKDRLVFDHVLKASQKAQDMGYEILIYTARGMRSYNGDVEAIEKNVLPTAEHWVKEKGLEAPIKVGKPWCRKGGFYVDDRCMTPTEFVFKFLGPFADVQIQLCGEFDKDLKEKTERLFFITEKSTWKLTSFDPRYTEIMLESIKLLCEKKTNIIAGNNGSIFARLDGESYDIWRMIMPDRQGK